jgi:hypothetical protein
MPPSTFHASLTLLLTPIQYFPQLHIQKRLLTYKNIIALKWTIQFPHIDRPNCMTKTIPMKLNWKPNLQFKITQLGLTQ